MRLTYNVPVITIHTPLDINNPVITCIYSRRVLEYDIVEQGVSIGLGGSGYAERLRAVLRGFLEKVFGEMGTGIEVYMEEPLYALGEYAAATTRLLIELGLDEKEAVELGVAIDRSLGLDAHYTYALRTTELRGKPLIIRAGEEPHELEGIRVDKITGHEMLPLSTGWIDEDIYTHIVHLGGYAAISLAKCLITGGDCRDVLRLSARVTNSIYYILYGVAPGSLDEMIYVPDITGYLTTVVVSLNGKRRGDG